MNCKKVKKQLLELNVGHALSPRDNRKIKDHLAHCERCEREKVTWATFFTNIKRAAVDDPGLAFWQNFTANLTFSIEKEREVLPRPAPRRFSLSPYIPAFQMAMAGAMVVVVVLGGALYFKKEERRHIAPLTLEQVVREANDADTEGMTVLFEMIDDNGNDLLSDGVMEISL